METLTNYLNWEGLPAVTTTDENGVPQAYVFRDDQWQTAEYFEVAQKAHILSEAAFNQMYHTVRPPGTP